MNKIGFSGIASTGKTTLARAFAAKCQFLVDNIKLVDEYATDYLSKFESLEFTLWEQKLFIIEQLKKEKLIPSKTQLIVTDSPLTTGFMYCVDIFNRSPKTTKDIMLMTAFC